MSKIIKIYCEGKKGSHDYDILENVIKGISSQIQIEPIGSIRGAGAIIQYKETEIVKSDFKILFRDRDFDKPIPEKPILEKDSNREYIYYSYRNTIENYLFNTSHFYSFLIEKKLDEKYSVRNEIDVKEKFISAANKIKYYQAVRHTMGKMRTGETNFGTRWTKKSGVLPANLDEGYCKRKAIEKIMLAKTLTDNWDENGFNDIYQTFIKKFDSDKFLNNLEFLIYFQGKDFASALKQEMRDLSLKDYYRYAKKHFNFLEFKDLIELRRLIEKNI